MARFIAVEPSAEWEEAFASYRSARWSLYNIEVLSHHFCSHAPFPREDAPAYPRCLRELQTAGLMDKDRRVTAAGVRFIAAICNTAPEPAAAEAEG